MLEHFDLDAANNWIARPGVPQARSLGVTLARYRSQTLVRFYLPSFAITMALMRETLAEIDAELGA